MKSSTRLESAVFHLTPTRTRCDLIINSVNGKTEKIASGLLNPFLAHLKTAQDQISQGGYSIRLEPEPGNDATWFTKGTVDRFVRFVSTPEVLERVYTIESEILQIEKAIEIQGNNDMGLNSAEVSQPKTVERIEGSKPTYDKSEEMAIVLYKPSADLSEVNGFIREENSKVKLLRVLETRKIMLRKEQGMAFARAVAAGFDIDQMEPLIYFCKFFGASRLMDACLRFNDLWKRKHETGQWLELEAAEATPSQKDFREGWPESRNEVVLENNGKPSADTNGDKKSYMDHQVPVGHQEYFQGHFPHHMYPPPWYMHSQPGTVPAYQPYPMQGMPYYTGNNPYFQQPYISAEESKLNTGQSINHMDDLELSNETSHIRESHKKASQSSKKKSGTVVIRNINYITSKRRESSDIESESLDESQTESDSEDVDGDDSVVEHKGSMGPTKKKRNHAKYVDPLNTANGSFPEKETGGGQWLAFQKNLLKSADEETLASDKSIFTIENGIKVKKGQSGERDPLAFIGHDPSEIGEAKTSIHNGNENATRILRASNDQLLISRREGHSEDGFGDRDMDVQFAEDGRRVGTRRRGTDDFMIHGRDNQFNSTRISSNSLGYERRTIDLDKGTSHNLPDESFIVPLRSFSQNQNGTNDRSAIHMASEFSSTHQKGDQTKTGNQVNYEPDDFGLMPDQGIERGSIGYDPSIDRNINPRVNNAASVNEKIKTDVNTDAKKGSKKPNKERPTIEKKKMGVTRQGMPSKLSPSDEVRARADKLRIFKAGLQKEKKEKEEEQIKRLEALKMERQKRIAARNTSTPALSPWPSQPIRKKLPTNLSTSSSKEAKFSDAEPGFHSPLLRLPIKAGSLGSGELTKRPSKTRSSNESSNPVKNRLTRSVSSLSESRKAGSSVKSESKASMTRMKRLSEPRMSSGQHGTSIKLKISDGPERKKISASIINLDRTKAATLPEIKVRPSMESLNLVQAKSTARDTAVVDEDDKNMLIEKSGMIQEYEKPFKPIVVDASQGKSAEIVSEHISIHATASPITLEPMKSHSQDPHNYKVTTVSAVKDSPQTPSISIDEKLYKAPYARVSSLEDPSTNKTPPKSQESVITEPEPVRVQLTDYKNMKLEKIPETLEKPHDKESSKGFRNLLKFRKKKHSSSEPDNTSVNGSEGNDSGTNSTSTEVHTLKNLIACDETPPSNTSSEKPSRHFSLLSPFRKN